MRYQDDYPEHSRTSCSDADPCNAEPSGDGCHRCNAILFDRYESLKKEHQQMIEETEELSAAIGGQYSGTGPEDPGPDPHDFDMSCVEELHSTREELARLLREAHEAVRDGIDYGTSGDWYRETEAVLAKCPSIFK